MITTKLDTLHPELLSYICELIYHTHKPSLRALTLVNKRCVSEASKFLFRDICFSYRSHDQQQIRPDCETWETLLTRRECLESVRCLYVRGTLWPMVPMRFHHNRHTVLEAAEWDEGSPDESEVFEQELVEWEGDALAQLVGKLSFLERLHWAVLEQVPKCILVTVSLLRIDFRLEMPEWRLRFPAQDQLSLDQKSLVTCSRLRSVTARVIPEDLNKDALMRMLGGLSPALQEVRIIECESLTTYDYDVSEESRRRRLQEFCGRSEQNMKARLKLFSLHGKGPIESRDLEQWFIAADMTSLQRLELRSGVRSVGIWKSTMRAQPLPHLQELLLGFGFDCTSEEHDAVTEWIQNLCKVQICTLQSLELRGNIAPNLVNVALQTHGKTLRKVVLVPQAHMSIHNLRYASHDLKSLNILCPSLGELTIPLERGRAIGNEYHEVHNYAAFGQFANLTHLHVILDCSRWGEMRSVWMLQGSEDEMFEEQQYISLDARRITYRHVRYALINSAVDENLAKTIWNLVTTQKVGLPLHELYVQPYGSMEIITGFRPDDRPELAGRLIDIYAMLREVSRSYKISRHIRDDVDELIVREPPGAILRGHWSKIGDEKRKLGEVVCHLEGSEMEIFKRIWPRKEGSHSWRDDWYSLELPVPGE